MYVHSEWNRDEGENVPIVIIFAGIAVTMLYVECMYIQYQEATTNNDESAENIVFFYNISYLV